MVCVIFEEFLLEGSATLYGSRNVCEPKNVCKTQTTLYLDIGAAFIVLESSVLVNKM